jgi:acetyltransferase-like isoleucine patch superfamily enzyme
MNFLVDIVGRLFYVPYRLAAKYGEKKILKILLKGIAIDKSSKILPTAGIRNYQRDKSKIQVGAFTMLAGELMIFKHGGKIAIGDDCFIGENTRIWSAKEINIGNRVLISHNVNIHDQNSHPLDSLERHKDYQLIFENGLPGNVPLNEKEVIIEDDVWIGFNSSILKGVRIGKGAIIGANTVITSDVPPYAVIVGNPPKIIKQTT